MKYFSVDRIEKNIAICQDDNENIFKISTELLPSKVKETDCLIVNNKGEFVIDIDLTLRLKNQINDLEKGAFGEK